MRRYVTLAAVVVALAMFIPAHAADVTVRSAGGSDPTGFFAPPVLLGGPNDKIILMNVDSVPHTWVTSAAICKNPNFPFQTAPVSCNIGGVDGLPPGQSGFAQLQASPGIYEFYCNFHSLLVSGNRIGMVGRLRVA